MVKGRVAEDAWKFFYGDNDKETCPYCGQKSLEVDDAGNEDCSNCEYSTLD
ncbi:MAG: hypothetical protein GWO84_03615 [Euryarchaeota archaeon]|nr:hypothetical protein [Euryarchaeota archaeon]